MRGKLVTILAILAAVVGWWGIYELTSLTTPDEPGVLAFFFALLFLAVTATLIPPATFLNRRFSPENIAVVDALREMSEDIDTKEEIANVAAISANDTGDRWRALRHSAWGGICVTSWAWLQMYRAFDLGFALITILIFVAIEVLITRLRVRA